MRNPRKLDLTTSQALVTQIATKQQFTLKLTRNNSSSLIWTTFVTHSGRIILLVSYLILLICSELWSPKEIALFNTCICRFEKEFEVFTHYVSPSSIVLCKNCDYSCLTSLCRYQLRLMGRFTTFIAVGSKQNTTKLGNYEEKSELRPFWLHNCCHHNNWTPELLQKKR